MRLLTGQDAFVAEWVGQRIPHVGSGEGFGPSVALGLVDEHDILRAGAVYHNYQPAYRGIEISFALDPTASLGRDGISALLRYGFGQLQCQRVTAVAPRKATSTRRFLEKLGFKREGCCWRGFGTDHAVIYGLYNHVWAAHPFNRDRREVACGQKDAASPARA